MQVLDKEVLRQLVGGSEPDGGQPGGEGGGGLPGSGGDGGGSGFVYDIMAVGIEGGADAVVEIKGVSLVLEQQAPPIQVHQPGEAPWEGGAYLGAWVEPGPLSFDHQAFDTALIGAAARVAGAATAAIVTGALEGMGVGAAAGPGGAVAGIVIGAFVGAGTYYLLQRDHPTGHFEGPGSYPRQIPIMGPAPAETQIVAHPVYGNDRVMQMAA
ncbi:hypothetical protein IV454_07210 [Massilia antarctica]|uniref:Uncharacterized protein n=1 Tax=Massilia antarctica TaxID=2765360 RepID=A0AA49A9D7_9BURK|nr:hypothetical protein [Massilia antarctica]QPI51304.1 hypothetical protein IV454_07210 [Massilia antarctica]